MGVIPIFLAKVYTQQCLVAVYKDKTSEKYKTGVNSKGATTAVLNSCIQRLNIWREKGSPATISAYLPVLFSSTNIVQQTNMICQNTNRIISNTNMTCPKRIWFVQKQIWIFQQTNIIGQIQFLEVTYTTIIIIIISSSSSMIIILIIFCIAINMVNMRQKLQLASNGWVNPLPDWKSSSRS